MNYGRIRGTGETRMRHFDFYLRPSAFICGSISSSYQATRKVKMETLRVAIIGTGRPWKSPGATGFGMAHSHIKGYKQAKDVKVVALADLVEERAKLFVTEHVPDAKIYTDYHQMLLKEKPDMVSICTWPVLHSEMTIAAAKAGVRAIHCEKPMAVTFGEAKRMYKACIDHNVQLTFGHQRRFNTPFIKAKELVKEGAIGQLQRLEANTGNMYDWGTHWYDMLFFLNDDTPVEWVIGQVDARGGQTTFGVPMDGQGIAHFKYKNDVRGLMVTGHQAGYGAEIRLCGSEGTIEIAPKGNRHLRIWGKGQTGWQDIKTPDDIHGGDAFELSILDTIDAFRTGREPELSGRKAMQTTELIFATYESSRRRGRIDLPLTDVDDSPFLEMNGLKAFDKPKA
jgi:UDP-N-acetylglucosamine 3-dehydrogenase